MICAIHQPNFIPWIPYFRKIQSCDIFVFLTDAQFSRDYYQHRFNIGETWYTMPVIHGNIPIKDKKYLEPDKNWQKIKRRLPKYTTILDTFDDCISESLAETNTDIIYKLCLNLGIDTKKLRFDYPTDLRDNDRLINICSHYGCDTYLSGTGARAYIDESKFNDAGIKLIYQDVPQADKTPILEALCR